jgi:SAM-dependent methyltransferase
MTAWWDDFFDADYLRLWEGAEAAGKAELQAQGLRTLLGIGPGTRVLDAPCGYGRIARELAAAGAEVLGVDMSATLLAEAERRRGSVSTDRLRYRRHDLRDPLAETAFDVAINVFSSLGYGTEQDDAAILSTLCRALRPGGLLFVETMHRDQVAANLVRAKPAGRRLPDGTLMLEEPRLDPVSGRVETNWYWSGRQGSGQKSSSIRIYNATELIRLIEGVGFMLRSTHRGCFPDPFVGDDGTMSPRLGVLAVRV